MMTFVSVTTVLTLHLCLVLGQQVDSSVQTADVTPHFDCETNKFVCANNYSIPQPWLCDGEVDCQDGSDEIAENCAIDCNPLSIDCEQATFTCKDGSTNQLSWLCDGFDDCDDGSDEVIENCFHNCTASQPAVHRRRKRWIFGPIISGIIALVKSQAAIAAAKAAAKAAALAAAAAAGKAAVEEATKG